MGKAGHSFQPEEKAIKEYQVNLKNIPSKPEIHHDYAVYRNVRIPMRDGLELSANIFFPAIDGEVDLDKKYPVVLNRSSYMATNGELTSTPSFMNYYLAELGYVLVICASRGSFLSDGGALWPMQDEGWGEHQDGVDTMAWLVKQPWCDGRVATCGGSYLGGTQYALQLAGDIPGLETSAIHVPAMNSSSGGWIFHDEFADMDCLPFWAIMISADQLMHKHLPEDALQGLMDDSALLGDLYGNPAVMGTLNYPELRAEHGLIDIPIARRLPFYRTYIEHRDDPAYFSFNDVSTRKHDMKKPLLFIGGWFDIFGYNAIRGYELSAKDAPSEDIAKSHRLIVGPWTHMMPIDQQYPNSTGDFRLLNMEWIQRQLNGVPSEFFDEVPVALYVMGENRWRCEQQWPLPDAETRRLYLHSDGPANTVNGPGAISAQEPGVVENPETYLADPANPIFNVGGISLFGCQADQSEVEAHEDVLVFTSAPMEEDMEVTGSIRASFHAATSATDTDFFVRLVDVAPDGSTLNVIGGGRRGRYLKNGRTCPTALVPGEVNKYEFQMRPTSYVFKQGHRIRVDICSSDAKYFDVNPNAFVDLNTATAEDFVVATQTVYHDAAHPAFIELPVVPASHERNWIEWPFETERFEGGVDYMQSLMVPPTINEPVFKDAKDLPSTTAQGANQGNEVKDATSAFHF